MFSGVFKWQYFGCKHLDMGLICISLITCWVEYLFSVWLAIWASFPANYQFMSFAHFPLTLCILFSTILGFFICFGYWALVGSICYKSSPFYQQSSKLCLWWIFNTKTFKILRQVKCINLSIILCAFCYLLKNYFLFWYHKAFPLYTFLPSKSV